MKFDGTNWVNVGSTGFSTGSVWWTSLALSPFNGQPFVAFQDQSNSDKATVMNFDGTNWVNLGTAGFSAGASDFISLAFNPSDSKLYIAYRDFASANENATVMKFDGTNWVNVGSAGFSAGQADYTSLAFNLSGQPYVAYMDWVNSQFATVMKFDGTNWVNVGNTGFSAGMAYSTSLAFSPSGQPHVAYQDYGNSRKATVMKYDNSTGINEPQHSQLSLYPNPAIDKITIETSAVPAKSQLSIMNLNGQEIITHQIIEPSTQLDISSLPSGVYFVRLIGERTVGVGKMIKD
jgi:hypothetical protein